MGYVLKWLLYAWLIACALGVYELIRGNGKFSNAAVKPVIGYSLGLAAVAVIVAARMSH